MSEEATASRSFAAVLRREARTSSAVGGAATSSGSRLNPIRSFRSWMIASFASWSLGTKLLAVSTMLTSGSLPSFSASACAASMLGARISML